MGAFSVTTRSKKDTLVVFLEEQEMGAKFALVALVLSLCHQSHQSSLRTPRQASSLSSSGLIKKNIPSANKGDETVYSVTCHGVCRDVGIRLQVESGDADLYAREDSAPKIQNSDCDDCPLCR